MRAGMRSEAQSGVCLLLGATALRLGLSDAALAYVKPSLRPLLVVAGVVLVVVGVAGLRSRRPAASGSGSDEHAAPSAAWLLVLPVVAVFLVAPAPLGSYAAERQSDSRAIERKAITSPLPAEVDGAVPLTMRNFLVYAINGTELVGRTVRITGFTTTDSKGVALNRFRVSCCAADGIAMRVRLEGMPGAPRDDQWFEVEGVLRDGERSDAGLIGLPVLDVTEATPVTPPANTYEG